MRADWRIHPDLQALDPVLAPTYGLVVHQEQILEILNVLCGWSYAEAELVFNALRKKQKDKLAQAKPSFFAAGEARGFSREGLTAVWSVIEPFSDYSFQ